MWSVVAQPGFPRPEPAAQENEGGQDGREEEGEQEQMGEHVLVLSLPGSRRRADHPHATIDSLGSAP